MNGDLGRMFGGLGVGIDHPNVILNAETASEFFCTGQEVELTRNLAERFFSKVKFNPKVHINRNPYDTFTM
jgi:predicted sugar kinase